MTKKIAAVCAVSLLFATSAAYAGRLAGTGINGSLHDLNSFGTVYKQDEFKRTCVFCHTPHNAQQDATVAPLWNHAANVGVYTPYQWSSPMNKNFDITDPLVGPTRLCMACHDGVTAVDSHGTAGSGNNGTTLMKDTTTGHYPDGLGRDTKRWINDMTVTHPIGFKYDDAQTARTDKEIVPSNKGFIAIPLTSDVGFDTTYASRPFTYTSKTIKDTLYNGYMTCASCHDVHNTLNPKGTTYNYFLYSYEEGSAICLSCHVK